MARGWSRRDLSSDRASASRLSRQLRRWLWRKRNVWALVALSGFPRVQAVGFSVKWHISNAFKDVNCETVCSSFGGMVCTEECWPATLSGLKAAARGPAMQGACYDVVAGQPQPYNPSKDPETTLCEFEAGVVQESRCSIVPTTPAEWAEDNLWIRRLCPCVEYNGTTATIDDCGVEGNYVEPPIAPSNIRRRRSEWPAAAGPSPSVDASTAPPTTVEPVCQLMCVGGFGGDDGWLNGEYTHVAQNGRLHYWESHYANGDYVIKRGSDTKWRFFRVLPDSDGDVTLMTSTLPSASTQIPDNDFYVGQSDVGYHATFHCCELQPSTAMGGEMGQRRRSAGNGESTLGLDEGENNMLGIIIISAVVGAVVCTGCLICYSKTIQPRLKAYHERKYSRNALDSQAVDVESNPENSRGALLSSGRSHFRPLPKTPLRSAGLGSQPRGAGMDADDMPLKDSGSAPRAAPDRGVQEVAKILGADVGNNAKYEGPVKQWWGGGAGAAKKPAQHAVPPPQGSQFTVPQPAKRSAPLHYDDAERQRGNAQPHVGDEVRLCGFAKDSTWNGTMGVVEAYDGFTNLYQIELADGRFKSVRPENIQQLNLDGHLGPDDYDYAPEPQRHSYPVREEKLANAASPPRPVRKNGDRHRRADLHDNGCGVSGMLIGKGSEDVRSPPAPAAPSTLPRPKSLPQVRGPGQQAGGNPSWPKHVQDAPANGPPALPSLPKHLSNSPTKAGAGAGAVRVPRMAGSYREGRAGSQLGSQQSGSPAGAPRSPMPAKGSPGDGRQKENMDTDLMAAHNSMQAHLDRVKTNVGSRKFA